MNHENRPNPSRNWETKLTDEGEERGQSALHIHSRRFGRARRGSGDGRCGCGRGCGDTVPPVIQIISPCRGANTSRAVKAPVSRWRRGGFCSKNHFDLTKRARFEVDGSSLHARKLIFYVSFDYKKTCLKYILIRTVYCFFPLK